MRCPWRKGHVQSEGAAICKPRREALREPNLQIPWSWTSNVQHCEEISFCCFIHPLCGVLLWQPQQTNTSAIQQISSIYLKKSLSISCSNCWLQSTAKWELSAIFLWINITRTKKDKKFYPWIHYRILIQRIYLS